MLFKLHAMLPPDVVSGHRDRFLKIFKDLKLFYINASNLQYFKNLIQIPLLPDV
jgi:huntingtin interacting protein 1